MSLRSANAIKLLSGEEVRRQACRLLSNCNNLEEKTRMTSIRITPLNLVEAVVQLILPRTSGKTERRLSYRNSL